MLVSPNKTDSKKFWNRVDVPDTTSVKNAIVTETYNAKDPELNHLNTTLDACKSLLMKAKEYLTEKDIPYASAGLLLATAYKFAPTKNCKVLLATSGRECKKAASTVKKLANKRASLKEKGIRGYELRAKLNSIKETLSDVHQCIVENIDEALSEFENETSKLQGTFFTDTLKDRFSVDLSKSDDTLKAVVIQRAPVLIGARRPIDIKTIEKSDYEISHVESFLYLFNNPILLGFRPDMVPSDITETSLSKVAMKSFDRHYDICTMRIMHPTSKRVWFMVYDFQMQPRSLQFADRSSSPEFDAFRSVSNVADEEEVASTLTSVGFEMTQREEVMARWRKADNNRSKNAILMESLFTKRRRDTQENLRLTRLFFEKSQAERLRNIKLLDDDYHAYAERLTVLSNRFAFLTSITGDPDQGMGISEYRKLHDTFRFIESNSVRGIRDPYERSKLRMAARKDRKEAREVYWEYVLIKEKQKKVLHTIKAIKARIENAKKQALLGETQDDL